MNKKHIAKIELRKISSSTPLILGIVLSALFLFQFFISRVYAQKDLIIYVSTNCPHCAKVEEFIAENDLTDKIQIKNVTENQQFAEEYADFVEENEIPTANQGTPTLLFESEDEDDFEWVVGDDPIIEFLGEKYDIEIEETSTNDSGDYLFLAVGMIIVVFVAGYGIVNIVNGKKKN